MQDIIKQIIQHFQKKYIIDTHIHWEEGRQIDREGERGKKETENERGTCNHTVIYEYGRPPKTAY